MKIIIVVNVLCLAWCVRANPCTKAESVNITSGVEYENGSVLYEGVEYVRENWYEVKEEEETLRLGCPCIGRVCLWKCCGKGQAFVNRDCSETDMEEVNPFNPLVFKGKQPSNLTAVDHFFYMYTTTCDDRYLVDTIANEELYIQENGTLYEVAPGGEQWHAPMAFCVDMRMDNISTRPVAGVCYPEESSGDSGLLYIAYAIGLLLSVPFLLATFLVYAFVPELRNLHGMCLMAYCTGLIVAYTALAYLKLNVGAVDITMTSCLFLAFIVYYSFQTSFFWLNVMCFDIWRTFSGYRGGSGNNKRRERKTFLMYGLYAWGLPIVLTSCTAGMQFSDVNFIKPGFGNLRCWFENWSSELVYFLAPVLILVVCNVVFFSVTAHRIRSIRQETAILKGAESSRSDKLKKDKQRYGLYLKLFMVMGVNWTVEMISFAVGGSNWYWILTDISNISLGFFIFLIFVWKKKVRTLVQKRFSSMFGRATTQSDDVRTGRWINGTSSAATEDTRISSDDAGIRLKDTRYTS